MCKEVISAMNDILIEGMRRIGKLTIVEEFGKMTLSQLK